MHSLITAAALVASASLSAAAPANIMNCAAFEIQQVAGGQKVRNGALQRMKAYKKYARNGAKAPSDVIAAAAAQNGSVAAIPEQFDQAYLSPVMVGGNKLNLNFDTGSADLWVFSDETPSTASGGHAKYDTSHGTRMEGATWNITYGDQSGSQGIVFSDKVVVGGVTATSQAVEAATSVSSSFVQDVDSDGLLGLAFSSINTVQPKAQTTFFDSVKSSLDKQLFTVDLKKGSPGSYTFGYIDDSKHNGSITYVPVDNSQGFWQFTAGGYSVGGNNATSGSIGTAIADTGTSLLYLPSAVAKSYYNNVEGSNYDGQQGGYTVPCDATLPDFHIAIGGKMFIVPGDNMNYAPLASGSTTCFGGIQPDIGVGFSIFGDIFLKAMYVVFDASQSTPRIGFAQQ